MVKAFVSIVRRYEAMDIIDEEGRVFGVVNVVDALVLLLVAGVVVAGAVLVTGSGAPLSSSLRKGRSG